MGAPDPNERLVPLDLLDWPGLNGARSDEGDPRACRLDMLRGSHVEGRLVRFTPGADTLMFEPGSVGKPMAMKLALLRAVRLTTPLHVMPGRHLPPLRDYRVSYTDDTVEQGQVFATVDTSGGTFLYIATGDGLTCSFIPHVSVQRWEIDPRRAPLALEAPGADAPPEDVTATVPGLRQTINLRIASVDKLWHEIDTRTTLPMSRIGELLIKHGRISETDLGAALKRQKQQGGPLGRALLDIGAVDEATLNAALGTKLGMPTVDLDAFPIDAGASLLVPAQVARRLRALPIAERNGVLVVAIDDPARGHLVDELKFTTQRKVFGVLATPTAFDAAFARTYREPGDDDGAGMVDYEPGDVTALAERLVAEGAADAALDIEDVQVSESDNALTRLVNTMILDAHQQGVSDIHIETYPGKAKTRIRFRKDGDMQPYLELPATYRRAVIARIKIMASLDISERRKPQDGKIDFSRHAPVKLELRVATIPTNNGLEDVVMRLLASSRPVPLAKLGLSERNRQEIEKIAARPYGLFLVCGPTGSGKTTTLHSCLAHMNTPDRKIWTAEDPVEITQAGLRQVQVNPRIGWTFADALRAFLRADPDVIMIGEMRDQETSRIAVEASLTGHLVLSTLHTNSAAESVVRLLDMGLDPFNFADALLGVLAQRLVRRLCEKCRVPKELEGEELDALVDEYSTQIPEAVRPDRKEMLKRGIAMFGNEHGRLQLWHAPGCKHCNQTGYKGRAGIHELLVADRSTKRLIQTGGRVEQIVESAVGAGMRTLRQDGIQKALMGVTDMTEVRAASNL